MKLTRRTVLRSGTVVLAAPVLDPLGLGLHVKPAAAQAPEQTSKQTEKQTWRHSLSLFDEIKYPPGFKHFEYVNPQAPKGGAVRLIAVGTFDNFNVVVSGVRGSLAMGLQRFHESL